MAVVIKVFLRKLTKLIYLPPARPRMEVTLLPQQHHLQAEANLEEGTLVVEIQRQVRLVQQLPLQLRQLLQEFLPLLPLSQLQLLG